MKYTKEDYIGYVAVIHKGTLYSLPRPNRHHNVLRLIWACTKDPVCGQSEGFLDRYGNFISRELAAKIVLSSGQPLREYKGKGLISPNIGLFSEDLW